MSNNFIDEVLNKDLEKYRSIVGNHSYPFPVEDFALKVFGLDVQYVDFEEEFKSNITETNEIFGAIYPDKHYFYGQDKVILVNTNRKDFYIGDLKIPKELYLDNSERQTIAHEIGHYSEIKTAPTLFSGRRYDDAPSILLDDSKHEVFANIYARKLIMPEQEVKNLKAHREITGPINLLNEGIYFKEYFGVTEFMLEVRLKELNISFINGFYIKRNQKSKGDKYTEDDLLTLLNLALEYDLSPHYGDCEKIVMMYNKLRNQDRDSGSIYMVINRLNNGVYDKIESVAELRIKYSLQIMNKVTTI